MKIVFVVSSLTAGGAERVISIMANYWVRNEDDVTIITMDNEVNDFYVLDKRIKRVSMDMMKKSRTVFSALKNNVFRLIKLRKVINENEPEVVISFIHRMNVIVLMATIGMLVPVVVSERTDTRQHPIGYVWESLRRWFYPRAKSVVVQTESMSEWAEEFLPLSKISVIPNPVLEYCENDSKLSHEYDFKTPFIVAMGRLAPAKGFDLLIKAFAKRDIKECSLVILGDGSERDYLQGLAQEQGVGPEVYFPGNINKPGEILKHAKMYVLSSRFEGFPNALLEAMSCGLPVISFDCPSGPREIIRDGVNGLLVPHMDIDELAHAINYLMKNEKTCERLGDSARGVVKKYSLTNIMGKWEEVIR